MPTSTSNIQGFFGKQGTEEHNFQEDFDHYREKRSGFLKTIWAICVNILVLRGVLILLSNHFSQLQSTLKKNFKLFVVQSDFFVSCSVKYPDTKLNSPRDVLNCMRKNYQFSFLSNFGKVVVILSIVPAPSCSVERSFSLFQKLKTYLRSTRDQDCHSHLALLRTEHSYSNRKYLSSFYLFWIL